MSYPNPALRLCLVLAMICPGLAPTGCKSTPPPPTEEELRAERHDTLDALYRVALQIADPASEDEQRALADAAAALEPLQPNASVALRDMTPEKTARLDRYDQLNRDREVAKSIDALKPMFARFLAAVRHAQHLWLVRFDGFRVDHTGGEPGWRQDVPFQCHFSIDGVRQYRTVEIDGHEVNAMRNFETGTMEFSGKDDKPFDGEVLALSPQFMWWRLIRFSDRGKWTLWNFGSCRRELYLKEVDGIDDTPSLRSASGQLLVRKDGRWSAVAPSGDWFDLADDTPSLFAQLKDEADAQFHAKTMTSRRDVPEQYVPDRPDVWLRLTQASRGHALALLSGVSEEARLADMVERAQFMLREHGAAATLAMLDWTLGLDNAGPVLKALGWTLDMLTPALLNLAEAEAAAFRQLNRSIFGEGRSVLFPVLRSYARQSAARAYGDAPLLPGETRTSDGLPRNLHPILHYVARLTGSMQKEGLGCTVRLPEFDGEALVAAGRELARTNRDLGKELVEVGKERVLQAAVRKALSAYPKHDSDVMVGAGAMSRVWPYQDADGALGFLDAQQRTHTAADYRRHLLTTFNGLPVTDRWQWQSRLGSIARGAAALDRWDAGSEDDRLFADCIGTLVLARSKRMYSEFARLQIPEARYPASPSGFAHIRSALVDAIRVRDVILRLPADAPSEVQQFATVALEMVRDHIAFSKRYEASVKAREEAERQRKEEEDRQRKIREEADRISRMATVAMSGGDSAAAAGPTTIGQLWAQRRQDDMDARWSDYMRSGDRGDFYRYKAAAESYRSSTYMR